jgi:hypothetical protein
MGFYDEVTYVYPTEKRGGDVLACQSIVRFQYEEVLKNTSTVLKRMQELAFY